MRFGGKVDQKGRTNVKPTGEGGGAGGRGRSKCFKLLPKNLKLAAGRLNANVAFSCFTLPLFKAPPFWTAAAVPPPAAPPCFARRAAASAGIIILCASVNRRRHQCRKVALVEFYSGESSL